MTTTTLSLGLLLVIVAVVLFSIAAMAVVFDMSNEKVYPAFMALGGAFGFLGVKLP